MAVGSGIGLSRRRGGGSGPGLDLDFTSGTMPGSVTFTRASTAWGYNSSGVLTSFATNAPVLEYQITSTTTNFLKHSQDFTNAAWTTWNGSTPIVTSNTTLAPDGTTTADTITYNTASYEWRMQSVVIDNDSVMRAATVYYKAGTAATWQLVLNLTGGSSTVSNYTIVNSDGSLNFSNVGGTSTSVGGGWFRVVVYATNNASGNTTAEVGIQQHGAVQGTVIVWGAQLEIASAAGAYVPTTTLPASVMTTTAQGLRIEEARTNLARFASEFDNASWDKSWVTITANAVLAPDGTLTADMADCLQAGHAVMQQVAVSASTTYTYSFWVKRGTATDLKYSIYNLSAGADLVASTSYYSQTSASAWARISFTFTTPVGCTSILIGPERDSGVTGTLYLWGSQLELGSFATSYIPTSASTASRAADVATITPLGSWFNASEGTVAVDSTFDVLMPAATYGMSVSFDDGGFNNRMGLVYNPDLQRGFYVIAGGVQQSASMDVWDVVAGAATKQAFAYKVNDLAYCYDGATPLTDATASIPTVTTFRIGASVGTVAGSQHFRRIRYWNTRQSNATLQGITS